MAARITDVKITPHNGRAHFPEAVVTKIDPPPGVVVETTAKAVTLSYEAIGKIVDAAKLEGFDRGAIVAIPGHNFISADVWNWGFVTGLNYSTPPAGKQYEGPIIVKWPFKIGPAAAFEYRHWPDELYLIDAAPEKSDIDEMTKEMKLQFAVAKRK